MPEKKTYIIKKNKTYHFVFIFRGQLNKYVYETVQNRFYPEKYLVGVGAVMKGTLPGDFFHIQEGLWQ